MPAADHIAFSLIRTRFSLGTAAARVTKDPIQVGGHSHNFLCGKNT